MRTERQPAYDPQPARPAWGVRVDTRKAQSTSRPIVSCPLPTQVRIPLDCGPGGVAEPLVEAGSRVLTGQPIAATADGTQVHASISGEVSEPVRHAIPGQPGALAPCLVIRSDGLDEWHPDCRKAGDPGTLEPEALRRRVAAGGIVGLGGALFPTAAKLAAGQEVPLLILNGAECEPYISCDEMLLRERPQRVIAGARLMMRAIGARQAVIAIETDMPEAQRALRAALDDDDGGNDIGIAVVTAKYPAGGERQLIELLTGREVQAGRLPVDVGCLCQNVATAAALADWLVDGRPLISRIVTVTGAGVHEPRNLDARLGAPLSDLVAAAGGYTGDDYRLIMGGPMMGVPLPGDSLPVTKAMNCLVVATSQELAAPQFEYPCIRCGQCSDVCPARLLPQQLLLASRAGDIAALNEFRLEACIECGCCDYVCPSHIDLTPTFVRAKRRLRRARGLQARADEARHRSEAREHRLAARADAASEQQAKDPTAADLEALMARVRQREQQRDRDE